MDHVRHYLDLYEVWVPWYKGLHYKTSEKFLSPKLPPPATVPNSPPFPHTLSSSSSVALFFLFPSVVHSISFFDSTEYIDR